MLRGLERTPGKSWYGAINCGPREMAARFFVLVHDLSDCGVASIYCDESKTGPAEIVVVIPAERRMRLREDFAFELLAFARFLGAVDAGDELEVHDAIAGVLAGGCDGETVVLSLGGGLWHDDFDLALSRCVERVAMTLARWLEAGCAAAWRQRGREMPAA